MICIYVTLRLFWKYSFKRKTERGRENGYEKNGEEKNWWKKKLEKEGGCTLGEVIHFRWESSVRRRKFCWEEKVLCMKISRDAIFFVRTYFFVLLTRRTLFGTLKQETTGGSRWFDRSRRGNVSSGTGEFEVQCKWRNGSNGHQGWVGGSFKGHCTQ